jgi:hypothetical protein
LGDEGRRKKRRRGWEESGEKAAQEWKDGVEFLPSVCCRHSKDLCGLVGLASPTTLLIPSMA